MHHSRYDHREGLQQHVSMKGLVGAARVDAGSPPLPSWKLYENPFYDGLAAAVVAAASAAAAVATTGNSGRHGDTMSNEEDDKEEDGVVQKQRFKATPRASSASPPSSRAALAAAHQCAEKASWERNQRLKAGAYARAMPGRSSVPSGQRTPFSMLGRGLTTICNDKAHVTAAVADEDANAAMKHTPTSMQGGYGNDASVYRSTYVQGVMGSKEQKLDGRARYRATSKVHAASPGHRASVGRAELQSKEAGGGAMADRVSDEENGALLDMKSMCLSASCGRIESLSSPRSHLQPRPPSSTSDSPCSSKPLKAPKVSTRSPQLNRSPQPISPPLKTITLMRPKAGGDVLHMRNCVLKSVGSSHQSPLVGDDVEQLPPHTDAYNVADTEIITSPREYLKALNRSRGCIEESRMESSPVVSALSEELKRALNRVQELERFQTSARKEVDGLLKRFSDERALLRNREQEKIQAAVFSIEEELDKERKLRKKLELENRKLSRNLAEANKAVVKAEKELDKERKARQLMEDVCDELAREIGEDKAEVEELKREHARAREEMDEERRTLQMTEAWREERVQMKLSEAKYELEERCLALDKLKLELELYLSSHQTRGIEGYFDDDQGEDLRMATEKLKAEASWSMLFLENGSSCAPQSQDDALSSDDIHSLRLSRDNTRGQTEWGGYSDARVRDRAKWDLSYAREESSEFIASDNVSRDESGIVVSKLNAYPDEYSRSRFSVKPVSRWGQTKESMAGLVGGQNGLITFDGSDMEDDRALDEENGGEVESHDADSSWRYAGENGYDIDQDQNVKWSAEDVGNIKASRGEVHEIASASEGGSRASSSPDLSNRIYKQGIRERGMYRNQGNYGNGRKQNEHTSPVGARHTVEDENAVSSTAELSPSVCKHNANNPNFIVHREDWSVVPVYCSESQGRRSTIVESSIPRGRRELAQWGKASRSNRSLQTTSLLDDRMSGLHLQARHPKGLRPKR